MNRPNPISSTPKTPYPFGNLQPHRLMQMQGRVLSSGSYHFGFKCMVDDDEVFSRNYSYNQLAMMWAQVVMNLLIEELGISADRISITADNTGGMNLRIEQTTDN
jgi:hypothetical protein